MTDLDPNEYKETLLKRIDKYKSYKVYDFSSRHSWYNNGEKDIHVDIYINRHTKLVFRNNSMYLHIVGNFIVIDEQQGGGFYESIQMTPDMIESVLEHTEFTHIHFEYINLKDFDITIFDHITEITYEGRNDEFPANIDKLNNLISLNIREGQHELPQLPTLKKLTGLSYNLEQVIGENLEELELTCDFNEPVDNLPNNLKILKFSHYSFMNDYIHNLNMLPDSIEELTLPCNFICELVKLPQNLKKININRDSPKLEQIYKLCENNDDIETNVIY